MLTTRTLTDFLDELASDSAAPGGGSVAALSGALGSALTSMVCRLTIGKPKYAAVEHQMEETLRSVEELRKSFTQLIERDTEAFHSVMRAYGMPKETEEEKQKRSAAIQEAVREATLVPLNVMELSQEALSLTKIVAEKGNVNSISDAGVAALMLRAASASAALNVRINLPTLKDLSFVEEIRRKQERVSKAVDDLADEILQIINSKL